jgi:hypothetical protein
MIGRRTLLVLVGLLPIRPLAAQFAQLGENKIQYRRLDWQVLRGSHVDLYYYRAEAALAPVALAYAEESYQALSLKFSHTVSRRIPLIVYASHSDFEQTNVLPFTPPEGLLGVTDYLKRRVTLPFRGNLAEFRHTLRHEMVHVFQLSLLYDRYDRSPRAASVALPLWWTEGLAEFWSGGEDARDEMILRDLVFGGRLPDLQELTYVTGTIVYPLGGRIHRWLAAAYGDWRISRFYHELWRFDSFEAAIEGVYGRPLGQLNAEFQVAMRKAYYPAVEGREALPAVAHLIATSAIKPAYIPRDSSGGDVVYASPRSGFVTLYRRPLEGGGAKPLVESGRTAQFESFHPFDSRVDASRPGLLLFSTKYQDRDALVIWDLARRRVAGRYRFDELVSILSPTWADDGRSVIFSGLAENGMSDLYRVRLPEGHLEALTNDPYQDLDPSLSPDGRHVVFASDRTADGLNDAMNLFVLDLNTRAITQLTAGSWADESPRWDSADRIVFSSNRDGVLNVFSVDTLGSGRRETSVWTGVFDATPVPGRESFLVTGFNDLGLGVFLCPADSAGHAETFALGQPPPHSQWSWPAGEPGAMSRVRGEPYRRKYTLDVAAAEALFIPQYGSAQGVTFLLSDLLSDNLFYVNIATYQGRQLTSLFDNVNAVGLYLNQTRRLNWGAGAFRFKGNQYEGDYVPAYFESSVGVFGLLRYPLTRVARIEARTVLQHSDRTDFTLPVSDLRREGWIASHYLSFVHDNALWTYTGPLDGHYLSLTGGISSDFSNARFDSYVLIGDARQYIRLSRRSAYAVRAVGFWSGADRPERVNIGGTLALRGYPLYGYIVGSHAWLINQEVRFPLLDYFTLGTPVGPVRFPEIQGALFADVGRAWFPGEDRAVLGSYGVSFRMPLVPGFVLRMDWGRRWSDHDYAGYGLLPRQTTRSFVQFFFGYNY